jgi:TonB family protein
MNLWHELAEQAAWWTPRIADHLWQATIFALLILAATSFLRGGQANLRHSLWMLASAKLLIPATFVGFLAEQTSTNLGHSLSRVLPASPETPLVQGISQPVFTISNSYLIPVSNQPSSYYGLYTVLAVIWILGSAAILLWSGRRRRKFAQALRAGREVTSGREWQAFVSAKDALGMTSHVALVLSSHNTEPTVGRVWRPVVMMPESIGDHLDDRELEAIMLHELVHIQRRDNLIGNLQLGILALFWFYPLVWFISRRLIEEREQACDEKVLQVAGTPEVYASSILKVVRFSFGWKVAGVSGAGNGSNLRRRVKNIMSSNNTRRSAAWPRVIAATLMSFGLVLMVVAGLNTRARALTADSAFINHSAVAGLNPAVSVAFTSKQIPARPAQPPAPPQPVQPAETAPPPPPPQPGQLAPVAQPPSTSQPPQPAPPAQPSAPTQPSQVAPAPPAQPAFSSPASPPSPPTPPTYERRSTKPHDQDDEEKGGLIEAPQPVYPTEARKGQVAGTVSVRIVIDENGKVISAQAENGPAPLRDAAVDAAYKARFKPTKVKGNPVKVSGALSYDFKLEDKDC